MHVIKTFAQILHIFLKIKKNNVIAKKMNKPYLLTFGKVKETAIQTACVRKLSDWNRGLPRSFLAHYASLQLKRINIYSHHQMDTLDMLLKVILPNIKWNNHPDRRSLRAELSLRKTNAQCNRGHVAETNVQTSYPLHQQQHTTQCKPSTALV